MAARPLDVPLEYVRLGLRFDRLESGFVDAYTGDPRVRAEVEDEPAPTPVQLRDRARALLGELAAEEVGAIGGKVRSVPLPQQGAGLVAQPLRRGGGLVVHLGPDPGVAGVRVDEAGLQPVEAQPQPHVLQGDVESSGCHGGSFAAPPDTATRQPPKRRCRAE